MQSLLYATRKHSVRVFFCCAYISFTSSFLVLGIGKIHTIYDKYNKAGWMIEHYQLQKRRKWRKSL